jgi:uncharacterized DUF497 family protein
VNFEWDPDKATQNHRKHRVSFHEAATVFADPLAVTYHDPDHSLSEERFITVGISRNGRVLIVAHSDAARMSGLSVPARRRCARENSMKKRTERRKLNDELRREYDLSKLKGVRGKYATRYRAGTNLVLLSPDVAKYFPDEQSVNIALRKLIHVTKVKKIS